MQYLFQENNMSLLNQIIAAVFTVLIGLVSGTIYIMSDSSKSMLLNQLESHSQDTATHLGLYMAPYIADEDSATIETIVNAIFDSGYYEKIQVSNFDGDDLFTALRSAEISADVPKWFIKLVAFNTPNMEIEVTHQWRKVGNIVVKSRAGYAYEELWKGTQTTLIWFITLSLICVVAISSALRFILSPLKRIEQQAEALSNKQYIEQTTIPKTKELKSVVLTMNSMIQRVRTMFDEQSKNIEELRRTAYKDELTGLANARATLAQLADRLDNRDDEGPCALFYVHITNLQALNDDIGQENANNLIKEVAEKLSLTKEKYSGSILGRLSGADFILLIPMPRQEILTEEANFLMDSYTDTFNFFNPSMKNTLQAPMTVVCSSDDTNSAELISLARAGITEAITENKEIVFKNVADDPLTSDDWATYVAKSINEQNVFLQYQPIVNIEDKSVSHKEILVRILNQNNELCTAVKFVRIVQELGLISQMDKAVFEHAINYLMTTPDSPPLAINFSADTLQSPDIDQWLTKKLSKANIKGRLRIEINESSVLNNVERVVSFKQHLAALGVGFGVDNFGVHPNGFSYLYKVQPDYIKIDGSLSQQLEESPEDRFFLSSLVTVANSLSITSYAERIERESQIVELNKLGLTGTQGFIHGVPENLLKK